MAWRVQVWQMVEDHFNQTSGSTEPTTDSAIAAESPPDAAAAEMAADTPAADQLLLPFSSEVKSKGKHRGNTLRIFISSPFRDFNHERDYLNSFIFPKLKLLCQVLPHCTPPQLLVPPHSLHTHCEPTHTYSCLHLHTLCTHTANPPRAHTCLCLCTPCTVCAAHETSA